MIESQKPANRVSAVLARVEHALVVVSGFAMGAMMLVVVLDVAMRYFLASPLTWSYNVIGMYLMVAVFFFALSDTLHNHGHIAIDVFQYLIPRRVRHFGLSIGYLLSTLVVALITWQAFLRFKSAYINDDRIAAVIPWPTWISYAIVSIGGVVITLRCIYRVVGHAASTVSDHDLVEEPLPPETGMSVQEGAE